MLRKSPVPWNDRLNVWACQIVHLFSCVIKCHLFCKKNNKFNLLISLLSKVFSMLLLNGLSCPINIQHK